MNRRKFITSTLGLGASLLLPETSFATEVPSLEGLTWPADLRWLWLKRVATGEEFKISYYKDGNYLQDGYIQACYALRDIRESKENQVVQMDFYLLDLIFACQEWLRFNSIVRPVHVLSGYRSIKTNSNIEGAARNSQHMYGKAVDIRIPGLSTEYVGQLGSWFQAGGTGWYVGNGFVHLDTGKVRHWRK